MADDERRAEIEAMARAMYDGAHRRWAIDPTTTRWPGAHKSVSFDALDRGIRGAYLDEAEDSLIALDRVRDARGDDIRLGQRTALTTAKWKLVEIRSQAATALEAVESALAPRSPQDEDHETGPRLSCERCGQAVKVERDGKLVCPACGDDGRSVLIAQERLGQPLVNPICGRCGVPWPEPRSSCPGCGAWRGFRRSPQGEDHEAGLHAATRALTGSQRRYEGTVQQVEQVVAAYLSRVSPSRDGSVADVRRLVEALRPFVAAYDAVGRTFCPEFNGPEALAHFDRAAEVLAEFSPAATGDQEENDERRP